MLYFACPLCQFELAAGTEICPNCDALFPNYCVYCRAPVEAQSGHCAACGSPVAVQQRTVARVAHVIPTGSGSVRIIICPTCETRYNPAERDCPTCGYRLCPACQIGLESEEVVCPRCGLSPEAARQNLAEAYLCPNCGRPVPAGDDHCPNCQQNFCPDCLAPIAEDATQCDRCGAQFEFACPACEAILPPTPPTARPVAWRCSQRVNRGSRAGKRQAGPALPRSNSR